MKIIFEDKEDDIISKFYRVVFRKEFVKDSFKYANGVGNLEEKVLEILREHPDETIYVFMDMPPGNREVRKNYIQLRNLIRKLQAPVIVFPIICAEYYLIKTLVELGVVPYDENIRICLEVGLFKSSSLYENEAERMRFNNFERYCKMILLKAVPDCMKHSTQKRNDSGNEIHNKCYNVFYTEDCKCSKCSSDNCKNSLSVEEKSVAFIRKYPCVASDIFDYNFGEFNSINLEEVHQNLVDAYNAHTKRLRELDKEDSWKYKEYLICIDTKRLVKSEIMCLSI